MRQILVTIFVILLAGCATKTRYQSNKGDGGYEDRTLDDDLRVTSFSANSKTPKIDALKMAWLRAIEVCSSQKQMAAFVWTKDSTETSSVYESFSYSIPMGAGNSTTIGNGQFKTVRYPTFEVYYSCQNHAYDTGVVLVERPAAEMNSVVNDLLPGLQVTKIYPGSPNAHVLQVGDILIKVNSVRIADTKSAFWNLIKSSEGTAVTIVREGARVDVVIKTQDVSAHSRDSERRLTSEFCDHYYDGLYSRPVCRQSRAEARQPSGQ